MITSIFNIFIFSITLIILCNFQCTLQFFLARIIRVFTLCSQAHWKQNSLKNSLIQASNIDEITNSNFDIFFSFDLGNVGFFEWNLFGLAELFIRFWMLSHSRRSFKFFALASYARCHSLHSSEKFPRKEVIQPHLPVRLPCYDFTPVTNPALGRCSLTVSSRTSGVVDFHGVTGGVYKTRERIQRSVLICVY